MLPLLLRLYVGLLREAGAPLKPRIESELQNHFGYMSSALGDNDYIVGPGGGARPLGGLARRPGAKFFGCLARSAGRLQRGQIWQAGHAIVNGR